MKPVFIRTPYNYDTNAAGDESGLKCRDPSRTSQEFKDEVDINTICKRFGLTGEMPVDQRMVFHGDFVGALDFRSAQDLLVAARESFDAQPAAVRARFHHSAAEFVDFCSDEKNFDEAVGLGMIRPEVQAERASKAKAAREAEVAAAARELVKSAQEASGEAARASPKRGARDQSST